MQLSVLESRLLDELPSEVHETVKKEFAIFEMETSRLSEKDDKIGQATLTDREIQRATVANQHSDYGHSIIELQCIKAAALKHEIGGWLDYVDPTLTYDENIDILAEEGEPTMKNIQAKEKEVQRWK